MTEAMQVVLVPGLAEDERFFDAQLPALRRHANVTIGDHTRDESMAAIARRVLASVSGSFALVGHSMGGYAAFEIVRQAPERVSRLALLDTSALADTPAQGEARNQQIAIVRNGRYDEIPAMLFEKLVHPARVADAALFERVERMALDIGGAGYVRQLTAIMHRVDSRASLARIRCPTLVLVGDADAVTPPERAQEIANGIAGSRFVTVPDCGHLCAMEQPDAVTAALVEWLQ
ncbi:MAG TPA: alpha/beta fold hydrolase [Candidatus Saccharimonadia bacterium]|nr:alpha/beta fold hydrolase [Candidatus Saccharimonadia bacterium]